MPKINRKFVKHLNPRRPLVFDALALGPGAMRSVDRTVPAPADLGAGLVSVPEGADLQLHVQMEGVSEGILVTATVSAPLVGECARCLEEFTSSTQVRLQELFLYEEDPDPDGGDGYLMDGDLLDLEPALRDALVLGLPLSPLCSSDCPGLCVECGARLADAGSEHVHGKTEDYERLAGHDRPGRVESTPGGIAVPELRKEP
jgi:uncharacterized protein